MQFHHGYTILHLAKKMGIKNADMAKRLGKSRQAVGYDLGRAELPQDLITEYCKILGITFQDFVKELSQGQAQIQGQGQTQVQVNNDVALKIENEYLKRENELLRKMLGLQEENKNQTTNKATLSTYSLNEPTL